MGDGVSLLMTSINTASQIFLGLESHIIECIPILETNDKSRHSEISGGLLVPSALWPVCYCQVTPVLCESSLHASLEVESRNTTKYRGNPELYDQIDRHVSHF